MLELFILAISIIVCVVVCIVSAAITYKVWRESPLSRVNAWFDDRLSSLSTEKLEPDRATQIRNLMSCDTDFWWYLGHHDNDSSADREPYYRRVIDCGRYLRFFNDDNSPSICYGIFESNHAVLIFRSWIEFSYQGRMWVLYEKDKKHQISTPKNFRIDHPGIIYRRRIHFTT